MNTYDIINSFKAAMYEAGIETNDPIIADCVLHRMHIIGDKPGTKNGAYKLCLTGIKPAGYAENFKSGVKITWKSDAPTKPITTAERQAMAAKKQQEQQQQERRCD